MSQGDPHEKVQKKMLKSTKSEVFKNQQTLSFILQQALQADLVNSPPLDVLQQMSKFSKMRTLSVTNIPSCQQQDLMAPVKRGRMR